MGYIRHNAIVVTSWKTEYIQTAAMKAREIGLQVIGPSDEAMNGYQSILICPDGSKGDWEGSDVGDRRRATFREWLASQRWNDGSSSLEWAEVAYSDDSRDAVVESHGWMPSSPMIPESK